MKRGLLLAVAHVSMVLAVAGKYAFDRSTSPRVWVKAAPYDPSTPLRGRYVSLSLEAEPVGIELKEDLSVYSCRLAVRERKLVCIHDLQGDSQIRVDKPPRLVAPVLFFIPEHILDPSRRESDEELWVEVTVPPSGPPRPIQLGIRKAGKLVPAN